MIMSAIEPLCHLIGINCTDLSKEEYSLLEADLFIRICEELKEFFRTQYKSYFQLMKFNLEKENIMLEKNLGSLITNDILSTKEYSISGIANYSDTPPDVIQEIIDGRNHRPSAVFLLRIIELHRLIRRDLYDTIIKKVIHQYVIGKNILITE